MKTSINMKKTNYFISPLVFCLLFISPYMGTASISNNTQSRIDKPIALLGDTADVSQRDLSIALSKVQSALPNFGEQQGCVVYNTETEAITECSDEHLSALQAEVEKLYYAESPQVAGPLDSLIEYSKQQGADLLDMIACPIGGAGAIGMIMGMPKMLTYITAGAGWVPIIAYLAGFTGFLVLFIECM